MAVRQRGEAWQVDVTYKGTRAPRVSYGTRTEALAAEAQFRADLMAGREVTPSRPSVERARAFRSNLDTIGTLFDHTFRAHWRGTKNERAAEVNGRLWVHAFGQDFETAKIDTQKISEVVEGWSDQGNAPGTINRKLAALRRMLGIAYADGVITRIPIMPKKREYAGRLRFFSADEEASLLTFFRDDPEMRDLIVLGLDTGFREGELLALEVRDYNLSTNLLHLWNTKSDAPRSVPLTDRASSVIRRRRAGLPDTAPLFDPMTKCKRISDRMIRWRMYAGIQEDKEAVFHTTRHTCCSRLIQSGVGLVVAQKWMGHKTIETTLRYAHLAPNAFDDALKALNDWNQT